jgi:hypothetical protein
MFLAGVPVPDDQVLELARLLGESQLAEGLEDCYRRDVKVLALELDEREEMLRALDDPPAGVLGELRAVLLQEHVGRVRDGLA